MFEVKLGCQIAVMVVNSISTQRISERFPYNWYGLGEMVWIETL